MDLDRRQRNDIDIVSEDHLTLALDALNIVNSPYVIDLEDYTGNNWLIVSEKYTKYNVAEEDMLGFMVDKIPDLAQKNITEMILGFDYTAADNMIISNVSFSHDDMAELELVNYAINGTGHIDISCDIFGLDEEVLNNIIVNQGFIIGINFNGDNSNASLKIWNVKLSFKFTNKLLDESNSVVNRLVPQVDFWREDDKLYLQIGDGSGRGHVEEQYIDTYTKDEIDSKLAGKVNVEIGKGLSSNDYTLTEKNKLASVEANANYYTHPASHNSSIIVNSDALENLDTSTNATQSEINNAIDSVIGNKQDGLISGENIKTINNESVLGSGNITIQGGSNVDIVTQWESTPSDSKVASEKLTKDSLDDKVSKSSTSGLLKNDGTVDTTSYSTFSGSYNDLSNKPSIPSSSSDLSDGSSLVKTSSTSGLIKNDGSIDTNTYLSSSILTDYVQKNIKISNGENLNDIDVTGFYYCSYDITGTTISNTPNNVQSPFCLLVEDMGTSISSKKKQTFTTTSDGKTWIRTKTSGNWQSWKQLSTFSGSYNDLSNKPSIPSSSSDLSDGSNIVKKSYTTGLIKNDGTIDTTTYSTFSGSYADLSNKPSIPSKVSDLTNDSGFITSSSLPTKVSDLQNDTGFITSSSLPTKTSDLTNDGDGTNAFLTQHQSLSNYIQKSNTNGLLKNDGSVDTTSYSTFSGSYNDLSNKPTIPAKISDLTNDSDFIEKSNTSGLVKNDGAIDTTTYSTFSGSYNDLSNKPTIPSKISDLTNDSDFIEKSNTSGLIKNDGSIDTNTYLTQHQSLTDYVQKNNGANTMTDSSAYSTIGTSANATQKTINAAIDSKLDDIYDTFLCENLLFDESDLLGGS